jgi:hypothetical protein
MSNDGKGLGERLIKQVEVIKAFLEKIGCLFCFKAKYMEEAHKIELKKLENDSNFRIQALEKNIEDLLKDRLSEEEMKELRDHLGIMKEEFTTDRLTARWLNHKREELVNEALRFLQKENPRLEEEETRLIIDQYIAYIYICLDYGTREYTLEKVCKELEIKYHKPIFSHLLMLRFLREKMDTSYLSSQAIQELKKCFNRLIDLVEVAISSKEP